MEMKIYTIKTMSGLHCGIGQGMSDIDLPTARESVSGYPVIPGSSVKGVLREIFDNNSDKFFACFGKEAGSNTLEFASALSFSDARLICLPVRSYFGTFAYLASPYSLEVLKNFLIQYNMNLEIPSLPSYPSSTQTNTYRASVPNSSKLISLGEFSDRVLLEDLDLIIDTESKGIAEEWAKLLGKMIAPEDQEFHNIFNEHFAIVDDNVMAFLCETSLPVAPHTRIGANGIVEKGALWYEEYVPPEAIFAGAVYGEQGKGEYDKFTSETLLDFVCKTPVSCQIGGNATIGRGIVSINFGDFGKEDR